MFADSDYSARENVTFTAIVIFLGFSIYVYIQRPSILFTNLGVGIKNPFSTIVLDWADVIDLETKFVLTLSSRHGPIRCWAAVGPSRSQHRRIHPGDLRGVQRGSLEIKAADSPRSDSGAAAHIARIRIEERKTIPGEEIQHVWKNHNSKFAAYCVFASVTLFALVAL